MMKKAKRWARGLALASGLLAAAVLAGCGAAKGAEDEGLAVSLAPEALRQIVEEDNAHGRTIMWQLPEQREIAVEWRESGGAQGSVPAVFSLLKGNQGQPDRYIYTARLTGLAPGRTYEYRLRAGDSISRWHPLKTDGGGPFSALIFPDSQSADYDVWAATGKAGLAKEPDAEFFISMGDLVDNGQDERQWQAWLQASAPLLDRMPAAPVMGNHEAYSLDWKLAPPERYLAHFSLPDNGVPGAEGLYYSFDWGPVHFSVVNTQMQELAEEHPDLLEKQRAWLEEDMRKTDKKWKVVLMHKDPLQYRIAGRPERKEGFSPEGEAFMPLFDRLGADAVISAHLHTYRNRGHIYDFRRDEKGPLYILSGVAGDVRYPNLWTDHALDVTVAAQPETDNFMTMEAEEDTLIFRAFLNDGTQIDEAVLRK